MSFEIIDIPDADLTFSRTWRESESMNWMERLKKEIEWLLDLVEERLSDDATKDHESLEDVMDAMGKTLRLVLDVGLRPQQPWSDLFPSLIHIHKSLCLAREIPTKNNHKKEKRRRKRKKGEKDKKN